MDAKPTTFRNLPLSREQDAKVREYIARYEADRCPWDTLALDYMLNDMLTPPPADNHRLDVCDAYAHELANRICRTGEKLGCDEQKAYALANGICTESEWQWIVREAKRMLWRRQPC